MGDRQWAIGVGYGGSARSESRNPVMLTYLPYLLTYLTYLPYLPYPHIFMVFSPSRCPILKKKRARVPSKREDELSAVGSRRSAVSCRRSAVGDRRAAIGERRSAVGDRPLAVGGRQSSLVARNLEIPLCLLTYLHTYFTYFTY